jgi:predicted esterase
VRLGGRWGSGFRPALLLTLGCAARSGGSIASEGQVLETSAQPSLARDGGDETGPEPAAFVGTGETVALEIPGYLPAVVWVPAGSREPTPVVVATHGAYDNPESYCPFWQRIVKQRAFVVCTRGLKIHETAFYYPEHFFIDRETTAAVAALRARFGALVADGPALYAGYSQGAIHGAPLLQLRPESHPRAVLIEGGSSWTAGTAARYHKAGGQRLLFVCGTAGCRKGATRAVKFLSDAGVDVQLIWVPTAGHDYPPQMGELVSERLGWLVGDDPRWSRPSR